MKHYLKIKRTAQFIAALFCFTGTAFAQLPNAWQINDNSTAAGSLLSYSTNLTGAQFDGATSNGWRFTVTSRLVTDYGGANGSMYFIYGNGSQRYGVNLYLSASGQLIATPLGSSAIILTAAGSGTAYHVHQLEYDPAAGNATYRFDGIPMAVWPGAASTGQTRQAVWGSASSADLGVMNFHRVDFEVFGAGVIASYDAGFADDPPTAPSPVTQGWTRGAGATAILEGAVSPDRVYLPPQVETLPPGNLWPGAASFRASLNPNGRPTAFWFEHGPTTNYGSFTATNLLAGTQPVTVSNLVLNLPLGVPYHYRAVALVDTNVSAGVDVSFTVPVGTAFQTGSTGGGQSFDLRQPSLELNYILCINGQFPSRDGGTAPPFLGEVRLFAGDFVPAGWASCDGHLVGINTSLSLYSVLGTTYGGDGINNFAVPDLRGRLAVSAGNSTGVNWVLGQAQGSPSGFLTTSGLPAHTHSLPLPNGNTGSAGIGTPRSNLQPSLALNYLVSMNGFYPSPQTVGSDPSLGQICLFAGTFAPYGWLFPNGQLLPITQYTAMFSLMGTTFGGNGTSTFGLPNLGGRVPMGIGQGPQSLWSLGQPAGSDQVSMTLAQMPSHQHAVPQLGISTGFTDGGQPQTLMQPSLALKYMIATTTNSTANRLVGQVGLFAGFSSSDAVPGGWALCNGQLLGIATNAALFSVISNKFGGDGVTTFGVPNLCGRVAVGSANGITGATYGAETITFTIAQLPPHTHTVNLGYTFDYWAQSFGLSNAAAAFDADPDADGVANGYEWATGTDPTNALSSAPLSIRTFGGDALIHFSRNVFANDVTLSLQRTAGLGSSNAWQNIASHQAGIWTPSGPVTETGTGNPVDVDVTDSLTNHPAANYRLEVTRP